MSKQRIEDLKIFKTLSGLIGVTAAKCELFKLDNCECDFVDDESLSCAFRWANTPQGIRFWHRIAVKAGMNA